MIRTMCIALAFGVFAAAPAMADDKEKALCVVCVTHGETEPEDVAATREHNGKTYAFCSQKCADAFDADPSAYVYELPRPAPDFRLVTLAGDSLSLQSLRGQWVLLDFWATWCKPCVKTMPELDAWSKAGGVRVIGIAVETGKDREKKVRRFLEKKPVSYAIALDALESSAWESYQVKVLPTMVLIDPEGRIVARETGAVDLAAIKRAAGAK